MSFSESGKEVVMTASSPIRVPKVNPDEDGTPPSYHAFSQAGVAKVEVAQKVWWVYFEVASTLYILIGILLLLQRGSQSKVYLGLGVALVAYIYSLDGTTTYLYLAYATSSFKQHSLLGAVSTAQAITLAVAKPISAKISDVFGRAESYTLAVLFYVIGYATVAASSSIQAFAAGSILYEVGYASLQILQQIIIADVTTLRWRGLVLSCVSLPFFINAFVASNIAEAVLGPEGQGWRWGYGMFCIIIPAATLPIIVTLFWGQITAKRLGVVATDYHGNRTNTKSNMTDRSQSFAQLIYGHMIDLDLLGLLLFAAGWSCVLLPLTLVNKATKSWQSGSIIAMLTCGAIILIAFVLYEAKFARKPLFPLRFFKSKTVVAAALIGMFDFVSFYIQFTYQYSFIYVTHPTWSTKDQGYFAYTQTLCLTFFAIMAGFIQIYTRRTKWLLVIGLMIRLLGVGLMIKSRGAHGSTFFLVFTQVIQGAGGGIAACASQLVAQASVSHQDVSTVTALILLCAEIGGAIGTAIASAVWKNEMPKQLALRLDGILSQADIDTVFGSITTALSYPEDSPAYEGIIGAYDYTMKVLLIAATVLAVLPVGLALCVDDIHLSDTQNAVEHEDLSGRLIKN